MWFLAYKNIQRRRGQALLTIMIVLVTIFVFTSVFGIMQVIQEGLSLSKERLGADAVLVPTASSVEGQTLLFTATPENIYMPKSIIDEVKKLDEIIEFTPQFYAQTLALDCCTPGEEVRIIGVDFDTDFIMAPHFVGESVGNGESNEIILGSNFPADLVGSNYLVLGEKFFVINQLKPTGTGMDDTLFMEIDMCRNLASTSEFLNLNWRDNNPSELISVVLVKFKEGVSAEEFLTIIDNSGIDAKVILTDLTITDIQRQFTVLIRILFIIWIALMVVTVLSIFGRFNALALERKKEIGLLRAMGMKSKEIFGLVVIECSIMSTIGGILGSVLATLSMGLINDSLKDVFMLSPSVWNWNLALKGCILGIFIAVLLGVLSSAYPALKSASLDPQVAITEGEM